MNQLFELRSISSPPEKDGIYACIDGDGLPQPFNWFDNQWHWLFPDPMQWMPLDMIGGPDYWYAPVSGGMRWRKCTDSIMPLTTEHVCIRGTIDGKEYRSVARYSVKDNFWLSPEILDENITHWLDESPSTPDELEELRRENERLRKDYIIMSYALQTIDVYSSEDHPKHIRDSVGNIASKALSEIDLELYKIVSPEVK